MILAFFTHNKIVLIDMLIQTDISCFFKNKVSMMQRYFGYFMQLSPSAYIGIMIFIVEMSYISIYSRVLLEKDN